MRGLMSFAFGGVARRRRAAEEKLRASLAAVEHDTSRAARVLNDRLEDVGFVVHSEARTPEVEDPSDREHRLQHRMAVLAARSAQMNALRLLGARSDEWYAAAAEIREAGSAADLGPRVATLDATAAALSTTDEVETTWNSVDRR